MLYEKYKDRAEFFVVYIQEAHPTDLWQDEDNVKEKIAIASPKGYVERVNLAGTCLVKLGIKFPALVDDFNNPTEFAYSGWPDRLYVIDPEGRIALKSDAGPFGFKPAQIPQTLERILPH
jgi:type I thyroxine 5'-deiodinase